jgi:hypothetical protein
MTKEMQRRGFPASLHFPNLFRRLTNQSKFVTGIDSRFNRTQDEAGPAVPGLLRAEWKAG